MGWQRYELVFRLLAPLHVGWRQTGNLKQTRGYAPGKNLWAALTARLTREAGKGADGSAYVEIGRAVQQHFCCGYLYPTLSNAASYKSHYPWEEDFGYLFLDSYVSAALNYPSQSAANGLLHETEFIAPCTRTGEPVYLTGALFVKDNLSDDLRGWKDALSKLQLGGDRNYGWGRVKLIRCQPDDQYDGGEPRVQVARGDLLTAHLNAENAENVTGAVEPLIGWERNNDSGAGANWRLSKAATICYAPGSMVDAAATFAIGPYGIWEAVPS